MPDLSLKNRAFLVTGPAKGMGGAITRAIAEAGGDLILIGRDMAAIERTAEEMRQLGRAVLVQRADVTDEDEVQAAIRAASETFPQTLYGAVNVAGVTGPSGKTLWEHSVADFRELFDVNVLGTFLVMKAILPELIARGGGSLVNIGGTFGFKGVRKSSLYGATKWTLRGMTKSAALEAGSAGVRVNMVSPGGVEGPRLTRQLGEEADREGISLDERFARFAATSALGRMSTAEDIANSVVFLLSDAARNITGQDLLVDGGTIV
ncbi:SDR family NAD(P)-dependent oxidoreductase [Kaistia dalseonensis]|uniref:NAD(P)-dependent dehydrogenase (Short-subunit alcohol dehydrogenase family) n=1 Tax=Kaistia dalseonensis TaxID=410840 RepID=A0ABU0HA67_9HYPH|nr:SDR family NAD(P)-dependent oxidoreductase [Kaistia dalseonensis]MCX5496154.1 SDR family NAD(P)-dependent oxidoreductase [Kaistia dalseonensis]MDQ0438763.1 NAD(P)-dependent dehydrogenase (short-subunit alcohol dehydrogenase family) [Kaistia dalseonensis]